MTAANSHPTTGSTMLRPCFIARLWQRVLDFGLVLWIVRVPLASALLGFFLLAGVVQAQDVLVEVAMSGARLAEQAGFHGAILRLVAACFLLWSVPVHYAARLILETDDGLRALVAERNATAREYSGDPAAIDGKLAATVRQVPRLLGVIPFLAFAVAAYAAIDNLPKITDVPVVAAAKAQLWRAVLAMLVAAAVFYLYTLVRGPIARLPVFATADRALGAYFAGLFRLLGVAPREGGTDDLHATGRLLLLIYGIGTFVVLALSPWDLAALLPLAFAVPLILGGWVPILGYLSALGRRVHFPFIAALLLAGILLRLVFGDNHDVRTLKAGMLSADRITLATAIDQWMRANGCVDDPGACPRPIIVAAAGGASRAGFFTASVMGHFLDFAAHEEKVVFHRYDNETNVRDSWDDGRISARVRSILSKEAPPTARPAGGRATEAAGAGAADRKPDMANHFFAISGVSGGSVGAVLVKAALDARGADGGPPCPRTIDSYWFGGEIANWRDCLEVLASGDSLTPTFFGLAFYDQVQVLSLDRAALLEEAWERHFARIVKAAGAKAHADADTRLSEPFLRPEAVGERWTPLLILNGTSVDTGQRIITTNLWPSFTPRTGTPRLAPPRPIFTHANDFYDLVSGDRDVALSTAASNSARFPVISPPGTIHRTRSDVVDRIVDGGYFENFGVESALELAQAMVEQEPRLAPFILVISNDPTNALTDARATAGPVEPDAPDSLPLAELEAPLGAIANVRGARGRLAMADAKRWLDERFGAGCAQNLAHIRVWPETETGSCALDNMTPGKIREISMSWWLSKPVQMNLREQLEVTADDCNNNEAVTAVWTAMATPSQACGPVRPPGDR